MKRRFYSDLVALLLLLSAAVSVNAFPMMKEEAESFHQQERQRLSSEREETMRASVFQRGVEGSPKEEDFLITEEETDYEGEDSFDKADAMNDLIGVSGRTPMSLVPSDVVSLKPILKKGSSSGHIVTQENREAREGTFQKKGIQFDLNEFKSSLGSHEKTISKVTKESEEDPLLENEETNSTRPFFLPVTKIATKEKSIDECKRKLLSAYNKKLTKIRSGFEIEIDALVPDDPEAATKRIAIYEKAYTAIKNNHNVFLKELDKDPSLQEVHLFRESTRAATALITSLPKTAKQLATIAAIYQNVFPRVRNHYESFFNRVNMDSSLRNQQAVLELADEAIVLLEFGFRIFNREDFIPIKAMVVREGVPHSLMEKRNIPYEPVLNYKAEWADDWTQVQEICVADRIIENMKLTYAVLKVSSPERGDALCKSHYCVALLDLEMANMKAGNLDKQRRQNPSLELAEAYQEALAAVAKSNAILQERAALFSNKTSPASDPEEAKQIALDDLWSMIQLVGPIANDLVAVFNGRKIDNSKVVN